MFKKKQRTNEEALIEKAGKALTKASNEAVKEQKITQDILIANGFTLELLNAFGGKAKHD